MSIEQIEKEALALPGEARARLADRLVEMMTLATARKLWPAGDEHGANLRVANYRANALNQYTNRDYPGAVDVMGLSFATNTVTVNGQTVYREGEYFRDQYPVDNSSSPVWTNITVSATGQSDVTGHAFVPKTVEAFTYDADGNLTSDGRWNYSWDGENRLNKMAARTATGPTNSLAFEYDSKGRRVRKQVWGNTNWFGSATNDLKFLYDGLNLLEELSGSSLLRSYLWGLDLSGSVQGAGGVGGLLEAVYYGSGATNAFAEFDGNGNVMGLINAGDATQAAQYEYGPFGEPLRSTGPAANESPLQFSTKRADPTTDLSLYEYRVRRTDLAWMSRDPSGEAGGADLYTVAGNDLVNRRDNLGLWATSVHHQIVEDWLTDPKYRNYPWRCCSIDVIDMIERGSDEVDGVGFANWPHWCEAQSSEAAYQHAMKDGRWNQSDREAAALYSKFVTKNLLRAVAMADYAKQNGRCYLEEWALIRLGRAYHSVSDSLSPAHNGFQPWWGPFQWWPDFTFEGYVAYLEEHEGKETMAVYQSQRAAVVSAVDKRFRLFLDWILKD